MHYKVSRTIWKAYVAERQSNVHLRADALQLNAQDSASLGFPKTKLNLIRGHMHYKLVRMIRAACVTEIRM